MNQRKKSQQEISSWVSVIRDAEKRYGLVINAEVFRSLLPEWRVLSKFSFDAVYKCTYAEQSIALMIQWMRSYSSSTRPSRNYIVVLGVN